MSESLLRCLGNGYKTIPTCAHYKELVSHLRDLTGWDEEEIRDNYGHLTYDEWGDIIAKHTLKF